MQRKYLIAIGMVALVALAGCSFPEGSNSKASEEIEEDTNANLEGVDVGASYWYEVRLTEKNQENLVRSQPPFQFEGGSLERQNLIDRYKYLNDQNNVHHVYLMSNDGKVISYFVAQGKVSSVNSKLTNDRQIVADQRCLQDTASSGDGACYKVVESPQMDGSYGENGNAIFFFTTNGKYVEWNGKYVVSEEPMNIQTEVSLVQEVDDSNGNETDDNTVQNQAGS
jgi:hypothetical protein